MNFLSGYFLVKIIVLLITLIEFILKAIYVFVRLSVKDKLN